MEDGLVLPREITNGKYNLVLILVVVEDGLVLINFSNFKSNSKCLNPCCSGRWSRTHLPYNICIYCIVLILVVVEDGLVPELNNAIIFDMERTS